MNPTLITLCGAAQLVILFSQSPSIERLVPGVAVVAILGAFAYTRLRWDPHVDMFLAMVGPGGLGMLAGVSLAGASCHDAWQGFFYGSAGMLLASIPVCWFRARCLIAARSEGRGPLALLLDVTGMQAGMAVGHLPAALVQVSSDVRLTWLHQGLMLVGMSLGMLTAAYLQTRTKKGDQRRFGVEMPKRALAPPR
jgi:hypothetical protein